MKIGFTGAGGTGKTTIATALATSISHPFMKSPSRSCFEKHGVRTEDDQNRMTAEQRYALQTDIFKAIDEQVMGTDKGVFDRTHLDNFGYLLLRCPESVTLDEYWMMTKRTIEGLKSFDYLFFAPMYDWDRTDDGMRTQSIAPRALHSSFIKQFLDAHDIQYYILANESVDDRLEWLNKRISWAL